MFQAKIVHKNDVATSPDRIKGRIIFQKIQIGFAPYGKTIEYAKRLGYDINDLIKAGLVTKTESGNYFEYMSNRLVFPIYDTQGRVLAFGGRTLNDANQPKYLNTTETIVYSKSYLLYGLYQSLTQIRQ